MERKLASIQRVLELFPIEGADKIEGCRVLGWEFVVKKGEFQVGELAVYFEIDSILPVKPEFEFLESKKYRIKTIKLKKQISQGLLLPIPAITYVDLSSYKEGDDVTEVLGVTKYDPPEVTDNSGAHIAGKTKGKFPEFLRKTDETRIQSVPSFLRRHKGKKFYYNEKCDGSSSTFFTKKVSFADDLFYYLKRRFKYNKYFNFILPYLTSVFSLITLLFGKKVFGVCSRNLQINEDDKNTFWQVAREYDLERKMLEIPFEICIQAELCGPGIQKNKYKLEKHNIFIFNAYNVATGKYLNYKNTVDISSKLGIAMCPFLGLFELNHTIPELVEMSKGFSKLNSKTIREGIVCRTVVEGDDEEVGRISFKVINPEFLLKNNE